MASAATTKNVYNFNAGPGMLPQPVMKQAQEEFCNYQGTGMSIMEMSHRGPIYSEVHNGAIENIKKLLAVPDNYEVLLLQGGAQGQFAMIPMNFLTPETTADYIQTGTWGKKAANEAQVVGNVNIVADTIKDRPARLPNADELNWSKDAAYVHMTSNETISGIQWHTFPKTQAPLIADMTSDILSRPIAIDTFGAVYASAQKNLGAAGVTVVIMNKDFMASGNKNLPAMFRYSEHAEQGSRYNTPPTYPIYLLYLVTQWALEQGGVAAIEKHNHTKAQVIYDALDASDFYKPTAAKKDRSWMNVTFRLESEELENQFLKEAENQGMVALKGHRSVGGIRASIYNAFPIEGAQALAAFMKDFAAKH